LAVNQSTDRSEGRIASGSIRLSISALDHLMTMVSELVLTRNQLIEIMRRHQDTEFAVPLQRLSHITAELQESVLKTRMQPIGNIWQKLPRIVRDLSAELNKTIDLELAGAETELDRQLIDMIKDPLIHMVRNAADHGLETREQRIAAGKPERGIIKLFACHEGGHILIVISDDGRGLDIDRIRAKAVSLGLVSETECRSLTESQIQRFIFAPGFSTADMITSISGRGIGMDVVRANIDKIGGTIDVSSSRGGGTLFTIKIPLTLAIVSAVIVEAGGDRFAIPQPAVLEIVRLRHDCGPRVERIQGSPVLRLREKLLPLVDLRSLLRIGDGERDETRRGRLIVVMQAGMQSFGLAVDGVSGTEEIVVKPLSAKLQGITVFSGNTILGDGSVILILDPNGVVQSICMPSQAQPPSSQSPDVNGEQPAKQSILVFRAGSPSLKAVPLSAVTRLEEIDAATIEVLDDRSVVRYRGQLMPLVPVSGNMHIKTEGIQPLLVVSVDGDRFMGLLVDAIVDIVEDRLAIEVVSERPGLLGSAVINTRAVDVMDVGYFLRLAQGKPGEIEAVSERVAA
jgi:two-component system chemotaxis sensor kinase CheA